MTTNELADCIGKIVEIKTKKRGIMPIQRFKSYLGIVASTSYSGGDINAVNLSIVSPVPISPGSQRILPPYIKSVESSSDCTIDSFSEFEQSSKPISIDELMGLPEGTKIIVQYPGNETTFEKYIGYFAGEAKLFGGIKLAGTNIIGTQRLKGKLRLGLKEEPNFYILNEIPRVN